MRLAALLRRALRTRWLHAVLAGLLLVAQHGALTHALAHGVLHKHGVAINTNAPAVHDEAQHESAPAGGMAGFCVFDLVYSQVLGGVHAGHVAAFDAVEHVLVVAATLALRSSVTVVPYYSHGPPVLS